MGIGKSINPGWFRRNIQALIISLTLHVLLYGIGYLILDRKNVIESELPVPLAIRFAAPQEVLPSVPEQDSQDFIETSQTEFSTEVPVSIDEEQVNKQISKDAADFAESVLQPWEIDVPPALTVPGIIGVEKDFSPLLDALPLVASIYLSELGRPFLILYDPMPNNEALRRLNTFFASSTFSPAMVQNQPVPSLLHLPLSVKGLSL